MKAGLKSIFSFDVPDGDLKHRRPEDKAFGIHLMLFIGAQGDQKSDRFDMILCTLNWFTKNMGNVDIESGQYAIFVQKFDYEKLLSFLDSYIERCEGSSWPEVAAKLAHLARWEFNTFDTQVLSRNVTQQLQNWTQI